MTKKYVWIVISCLLAASASAQVPNRQEVAQIVKEGFEVSLASAERDLIDAYREGSVIKVNNILTKNPRLANTTFIAEDGKRISIVYDAFSRADIDMLQVFYKHGAECKECLNKSLVGDLNSIKELTLEYQLPIYGVYYEDLVKLPNWKDEYLPLAMEVRVDLDKLDELVFETINEENASNVLDNVRSNGTQTQQKIENYRAILKSLYAQFVKGKPQVPSMEFPQVSVTFLDKTYEPKNSGEVDKMIENIKKAYQNEVETKYIAYGKSAPSELAVQRDRAIAQLNNARTQLVKYEKRVKEQNNIDAHNQAERTAANKKIAQAVKLFKGEVELTPLFFKHFPKEDAENWNYYPKGGKLMDIDFQIPVLYNTRTWVAYDALPETFGKYLHYKLLGEIYNDGDAKKALEIFAGSPNSPYSFPKAEGEKSSAVKAIFQDPTTPKVLYVILRKTINEIQDYDAGNAHYSDFDYGYLLSIEYGQRELKILEYSRYGWLDPDCCDRDINSWKKELKQKGYTLLWEAK